jgi:hypothetical protein
VLPRRPLFGLTGKPALPPAGSESPPNRQFDRFLDKNTPLTLKLALFIQTTTSLAQATTSLAQATMPLAQASMSLVQASMSLAAASTWRRAATWPPV